MWNETSTNYLYAMDIVYLIILKTDVFTFNTRLYSFLLFLYYCQICSHKMHDLRKGKTILFKKCISITICHSVSDDDFSNREWCRLPSQPPNRPSRPEASKPFGDERRKRQIDGFRPRQDLRLLHAPHFCGQSH